MKWLLVVIVLNSPVKTDLVFDTLQACLASEEAMRSQWATEFNAAAKRRAPTDYLDMLKSTSPRGTCIPAKQ